MVQTCNGSELRDSFCPDNHTSPVRSPIEAVRKFREKYLNNSLRSQGVREESKYEGSDL